MTAAHQGPTKDLANRLKAAEGRLPGALAVAYRHVVVPTANKELPCFDMGIATLSGAELLERGIDTQIETG